MPVKKKAVKKKAATPKKSTSRKSKLTDEQMVGDYMKNLKVYKDEVEAVRSIIKKVHPMIGERIKWKAPSYHYNGEDMVTFNAWAKDNVHLVLHHPAIVKVKSELLTGDYKDRRMIYFRNMAEVKQGKKELQRIMKELLKLIDDNVKA